MFGEELRNMHTVVRHTIFWNKPSGNISKKEPQVTASWGEAWMFRGSTICARPDFAPSTGMILHPCMAATEKLMRVTCLTLVQMSCCFHAAKCVTVTAHLWSKHFIHHQFFESSTLRPLGVWRGVYCLSVGKLFICVQSVHWHALPCQQNHCCIYVVSLQVLLSSRPKSTVKLCEIVFRATGSGFQMDSTTWQNVFHFTWKTLVGVMVCNYSPSGVETSERKHWNITFCFIYLFGIWQCLSSSTSTETQQM